MKEDYLTPEELKSALRTATQGRITEADETISRLCIAAAMDEVKSYLRSKYDTVKIFAARGADRNALLLEHCKSIAVWYLLRRSNADVLYEKARDYYTLAVEYLRLVAGIGTGGGSIAPDLPLIEGPEGVEIKIKMGSTPKFTHHFDKP